MESIKMLAMQKLHCSQGWLIKGNTYKVAAIYGGEKSAKELIKNGKAVEVKGVVGAVPNIPHKFKHEVQVETEAEKKAELKKQDAELKRLAKERQKKLEEKAEKEEEKKTETKTETKTVRRTRRKKAEA